MDIFGNTQFIITKNKENDYIFYNPVKHFATQLDEATLRIIDIIYTYQDINYILGNINPKHHAIVKDIYAKVQETGMLSLEEEKNIPDFNLSTQMPHQFYLHLTNKCNLKCSYCYNKDVRTSFVDLELHEWKNIIEQIIPYAKHIVLTGGEAFLHKDMQSWM
jgi:sulfatase maturation enzyme AslB (radical SAM superfamily)